MSAGNSAYSPLPQSNSDSDCSSEEELHVSQGSRIVNRTAKIHNTRVDKAPNEKNNVVNYKPLDNEGDIEVTLNKFHPNPDQISIVKPDGSLEIFSTSRKICFLFSLFLCVFTTVAFLWILPCNVGSCPNTSDLKRFNFTWEENLPNIEINGPITLSPDHNGNQNIVFLTRSFLDLPKNHSSNGIRCLKGIDGSLNWEVKLDNEPTEIDCKLFDMNNDGFSDCLIYGKTSLSAFDSLSGKKLWDAVEANINDYRIYFEDFPLVIPDLNKDKTQELLLPCNFYLFDENRQETILLQNYLVIISGKTGSIINNPLQLKLCSAVKNLAVENNSVLSYTCFLSDKKESYQNISLTKVFKTLKDWSNASINQLKSDMLNQHNRASDVVIANGFKLVVKNEGDCPEDCHVIVDVKDEKKSLNKTIYSFKQKNAYGMTPGVIHNTTEIGFVIKLWKWHSKTENPEFRLGTTQETITARNNTKNLTKRSGKLNYLVENSKILENKMLLESEDEFQRQKRTATGLKFKRSVYTSSLHLISETISKITLKPHVTIRNITKEEIIQICKKPKNCQPSVDHQRQSILVAQLVAGGTEKLITFNSKYVHETPKNQQKSETWQLLSTIRVLNI